MALLGENHPDIKDPEDEVLARDGAEEAVGVEGEVGEGAPDGDLRQEGLILVPLGPRGELGGPLGVNGGGEGGF